MNQTDKLAIAQNAFAFLPGGGELGERIRTFDWSQTPVGAVENWPQSLKTAVRIMLESRYPMFIWWGEALTNFYNDAYIPVLGKRHPEALGQCAAAVWSEIWPVVGPQAHIVLNAGRATWNEEALLLMERNQFLEETYFTFSYSPISDDDGGVGGVFCVCTEETERVLSQRRLRTLRAVAEQTVSAKTAEDACTAAANTLTDNPYDLPFALFYLLNEGENQARRAGLIGMEPDNHAAPEWIDVEQGDKIWPFSEVIQTGKAVVVLDIISKFGALPGGAWPESPPQVIVLPLAKPGQIQLAGFLVAGVSSRLVFNDDYQAFIELLAGHVATAIANARAYEEERRRAEALAALDQAKTTFFSNVSHEFRTPLTLMLSPVEAMLQNPADLTPPIREQLEVVHRNSLRLLKLVNTMLDFSRIEAGRIQAHYEPVDLAAYTTDLAGVFRAVMEQAGLRLIVNCPPLPEPVYVDRDMWEKIVLNLLSNAFKFTLEGEIEVGLAAEGEQVHLTVRDTGIGIPEVEMPRIFERFHRVKESRGRTYEGTGIGLALVQELVKLHGGTIAAASQFNKGSQFTVTIPLGKTHLDPTRVGTPGDGLQANAGANLYVQEALRWLTDDMGGMIHDDLVPDAFALPVPLSSFEAELGTRPRILWADDNADIRAYIVRLLGDRFEVETVPDGQAALEAARGRQPDLILSDVMMPRLDGLALLRTLRQDPRLRHIPIILLSARAGEEARIEGLAAGADDYLVKPFSGRELRTRIETHLRMAWLRQDANKALRESEQRFRLMADAAPVLIWISGRDKLYTWFNEKWLEFVGRPMEKELGNGWIENVHPDDLEHCLTTYSTAFDAREPFSMEYRLRYHSSRYRWIIDNGTPLYDSEGEFIGYIGSCIDINESKQIETALRESEARYRAIVESQLEMVCRFRPDGTILFVNDAYARARGTTVAWLAQANFWDFIAEEDRPDVRAMLNQLSPEAPEIRIENRFETVEGVRWTLWTNRGLAFDESGQAVEVQSSGIDITLRKQAEEALRESEQRFKNMADTAPAMIWLTGQDHSCTFLSRGWYDFTGQTEETGLGFGWLNAIHPEEREQILPSFLAAAQRGESFRTDFRLRHATQGYRWANVTGYARFAGTGELLGYIGSVIDIHERKQAEEKLRELNEQLEQRVAERTNELERQNQRLRQLANQLSEAEQRERRNLAKTLHDGLQQILIAGKMQLRLLLDDDAKQVVQHLESLFDEAIDVSRSLSYELSPPALYSSDLPEAIHWLARWFQTNHRFAVKLNVGKDFPQLPDYTKTFLFDAIRELLLNAVKHSGTNTATITLRQRYRRIWITVSDTGKGFDPGLQEQEADEWHGFGLFSIRERITALGGTFQIDATPGVGAKFILTLPLKSEEPLPEPIEIAPLGDMPTVTRQAVLVEKSRAVRVLIVDDHSIVRKGLVSLLDREADIEVVGEAADGLEALIRTDELQPAVVVMDIDMPRMNGIEATRRIKQKYPDIAVIGLSFYEERHKIEEMRQAGAAAYLRKGGDAEVLLQTVRQGATA